MARKITAAKLFAQELQAESERWSGQVQVDRRGRKASLNIISIDAETLARVIKATAAKLP